MPIRTCVGCGATDDKGSLLRVALTDGAFVLDVVQRRPGRGAYLHPGCAERALRTRAIQRTLRAPAAGTQQLARILTGLPGDPDGTVRPNRSAVGTLIPRFARSEREHNQESGLTLMTTR